MSRLIRLAFPQIVVLSFPAHVCNQGGVKCRPKCCRRINPASFGTDLQEGAGGVPRKPIMTFPPTEQLKAFTKKLISPRQRSSLEYNNKLITQSVLLCLSSGCGGCKMSQAVRCCGGTRPDFIFHSQNKRTSHWAGLYFVISHFI